MRRPWAWGLDPDLEPEEEARQEPEGEEEADEAEALMPTLVPTEEMEAVEAGDIETRNIDLRDSETRDTATRNTEASEAGESEVSDAREVVTPFAFTTEQLEVIGAIEAAPDSSPLRRPIRIIVSRQKSFVQK